MNPFVQSFLSWLCLPVYFVQGTRLRAQAMRLSPPNEGAWSGQYGSGKPAHGVLAIGDSSAAGVGIAHTSGTIGSQLAEKLAKKSGKTVAWRVAGSNSATAAEIRDHVVPNLEQSDYTHIIIMLGTNDMKNWHTVGRWKKEFGTLLYALRTKFPEARIFWHQAIDVRQAPLLPEPLGTIMNLRVALLNRMGAQLCVERGVVCVPPLPITEPRGYCEDGFHANEIGYNLWAEHMLDHFDFSPRTTPAVQDYI